MTHLNELPPCLLVSIFSYLSIGEVIRLKLVCKAWRETSAFVRFKSLSFYRYDFEDMDRYSYLKKPFPENFDLYVNDFEKFFRSTGPMVSGVKRLVFALFAHPVNCGNNRLENFLNRFRMLEELELNVLGFDHFPVGAYPTFSLELKRLRKLEIHYEDRIIELNCPELSYLDIDRLWLENCRIRYPEKLRTLVLKDPSRENDYRKFVNLKNLVLDLGYRNDHVNEFTRALLARIPESLRRLILFGPVYFNGFYSKRLNLEDHLRRSYAIDQEISSLKIFLNGIDRSNQLQNNEGAPLWFHLEISEFISANLSNSVDENICLNFNLIDYNMLERQLSTFDPFYKKLYPDYGFSSITIYESVADEDRLLKFLKRMEPCYLELENNIFPLPFFDRLAKIKLEGLHFNASHLGSDPGALDFLLRMSGLESVNVQYCSLALVECLDLLITAFERIESLDYFNFDWSLCSFCFSSKYSDLTFRYVIEGSHYPLHKSLYRKCEFEKYGQNKLNVLRYLNARLKQNSRLREPNSELNQLRDGLEFLFLIDELKLSCSAIKAIVGFTKAIPIYLWAFQSFPLLVQMMKLI